MATAMNVLRFVTLLCGGLGTGALWAVMIVVLPIAHRLGPRPGLAVRQNIDHYMDPYNPIFMVLTALASAGILILHHNLSRVSGVLTAIGLLGVLSVMSISLGVMAPIGRRIQGWTPDALPADFQSTNARWETFHRVRTVLALIAFTALVLAALTH